MASEPHRPSSPFSFIARLRKALAKRYETPLSAPARRLGAAVRDAWGEGGALRRRFPGAPGDYSWRSALFDVAVPLAVCIIAVLASPASSYNIVYGYAGRRIVNALWCLAMLPPVVLRRLRPAWSATAFVIVAALQLLFGPSLTYMDFFCFPMLFTVVVYGPRGRTRFYVLSAALMAAAASVVNGFTTSCGMTSSLDPADRIRVGWWLTSCIAGDVSTNGMEYWTLSAQYTLLTEALVALSSVMGVWRRTNRESVALLRERNAILQGQEADAAREAAIRERARIARDMHDVVAHTLSTIIIQADAGRYVGPADREAAARIMGTIRRETRHARHDMDQLLGVLSANADDTGNVAERVGYDGIADLVAQARTVSPLIEVTRAVEGAARPERLSGNASICVYRVVQEALTNVRKYARGSLLEGDAEMEPGHIVHATVVETWDGDGLHIEVRDDGVGSAAEGHQSGFGLMGMRERVTTAGGAMESGPRAQVEGDPGAPGFVVRVFLPYEARGEEVGAGVENQANVVASQSDGGTADARAHATESSAPAVAAVMPGRGDGDGGRVAGAPARPNVVERIARWSLEHTGLVDCIIAGVALAGKIIIFMLVTNGEPADYNTLPIGMYLLLMVLPCLPLCMRRRRPELCCLLVFTLCMVELLFDGVSTIGDVVPVTIALFAGAVYGRRGFGKVLVACSLVGSVLFGLSLVALQIGVDYLDTITVYGQNYPSPFFVLVSAPDIRRMILQGTIHSYYESPFGFVEGPALYALTSLACSLTAVVLGYRVKGRENNYILLKARHEALEAEKTAQEQAAAVAERTRISAHIQQEVADTLGKIARMADDGAALVASPDATGAQVADAFRAIGVQGRSALRRMRELLGVLRSTGGDFDAAGAASGVLPEHELRPARPIAEQLHDTQSAPIMAGDGSHGEGETAS